MAVRHHRSGESHASANQVSHLRKDIINAPLHVFGEHDGCASYFCNSDKPAKNVILDLKNSGIFYKIMEAVNTLADHSESLLFDANNNAVESYNSIIAKFLGGKRINFCLKDSYETRCKAAVVAHNSNTPYSKFHRTLCNSSPGKYSKLAEKRHANRITKARQRVQSKSSSRCRTTLFSKPDSAYGLHAEKPDMPQDQFLEKCQMFLEGLQLTEQQRIELQRSTALQSECSAWKEERRKRLTASNFGAVCCKLPHTGCGSQVKHMLYSHFETAAMKYGRLHESVAMTELERERNITVQKCGLFVDEEFAFLGATPDGIIGDDGIVEVKCPASIQMMTPEEAIISKKFTFWNSNKNKKEVGGVNSRHKYFFQVQGQLHITKRAYCFFVLRTPKGMKIEKILRDDAFWKNQMQDKLTCFYIDCVLPELIDPRYPRSMDIRNPKYILDAQKLVHDRKRNLEGSSSSETKRKCVSKSTP